MLIAALLVDSGNIHCQDDNNSSKKRVIENLSHHLAVNTEVISEDEIFQALLERERLGSTGLGKGVAIPHARIPGLSHTLATMMTLSSPINYDTADKQPVDIVFGLLVPEDDSEHHLEHLSRLVTMFRDPQICQSIRETTAADKMLERGILGYSANLR